ncbi:MAG TPA: protein-L-isoaspartate(D-aspartate) O-methyltransferase [Casimicrobiaceae bacterium]|nr:protein-L-isoaspartate(D-aspartate) O-methyltransferase [Casimicrobiaceae bacterium]
MSSIEAFRRFYAELIVRAGGASDERLIDAFASVVREDYLGPGPWSVFFGNGKYFSTQTDDPRILYQDVLFAIDVKRGINNGQPSLHAAALAACAPRPGERVTHVGAGAGYYTAVLAHLVGDAGRVIAFEIEHDLAERARINLSRLRNVEVLARSASEEALPGSDIIYVNAGATHPLAAWLDALAVGGRLVFPLTPDEGVGCMLMVTRRTESTYAAKALMKVAFIPCIGARDPASSQALSAAMANQSHVAVRSLRRDNAPDGSAWLAGSGWWLSTDDGSERDAIVHSSNGSPT